MLMICKKIGMGAEKLYGSVQTVDTSFYLETVSY